MVKLAITVSSFSIMIFVFTTFGPRLEGRIIRYADHLKILEANKDKVKHGICNGSDGLQVPVDLLVQRHIHNLAGTNIGSVDLWRPISKLKCKPQRITMLYICFLVMLQAGDCQPNPGPTSPVGSGVKFPCMICNVACLWGERAICCDSCNEWYHVDCMNMGTECYETLAQHSNLSWICCNCGLPNFASSLFSFETRTVDTFNSFSSLNLNDDDDDRNMKSPLATSSPQHAEQGRLNSKGVFNDIPNTRSTIDDTSSTNSISTSTGDVKQESPHASFNPSTKVHKQNQQNKSSMKVLVVNFQSIRGKTAELHTCLQLESPDLIIGTETWLNDSIGSYEIFPNTYSVFRKDRQPNAKGTSHGGVLIAVKSNIICIPRLDLETSNESVWIEIKIQGSKPILVGSYYRPPNTNKDYLKGLSDSLNMINPDLFSNIWLGGDFNLGDVDWENQTVHTGGQVTMGKDLIDIANDNGLEQVVREPTRGENILDLFFTKNPTLVAKSCTIPGISDHDGIPMILVDTCPSVTSQKPRKVYLYGKANITGLKEEVAEIGMDFQGSSSDTSDVNALWIDLKDRLHKAVNNNVPSKVIGKQRIAPWINSSIKRFLRRKQRAYNKAKKSKKPEDWDRFKEIRKQSKKETRKAHRRYVIEKCTDSAKKFWNFIKTLRNDASGFPALRNIETGMLVTDNKQKAELLNKQYKQQFTKERLIDFPTEGERNIPTMPDIRITVEGVIKQLKNLNPHKAAGPDDISPWVLQTVAHEISPALAIVFQRSFETGIVPEDWLCSNITPIFKKGDKSLPANYRSINLTSVCSKVFEHILYSQIMSHLDTHNILFDHQHGFRKNYSCETQLISTVQDIASELDQRRQVDVIIMDFQKAFDKVPHRRLLLKLWRYGIRGKTHKWIEEFLTKRKQRVVVEGEHSEWVRVDSSVPQGTVSGPLDFLLYINDLPEGLESRCRLFADDCILYKTVTCPKDSERLQSDLDKLTSWQNKWQMDFNAQKCYVMRISHARTPLKYNYTLNNTVLEETKTHKYLGVDISNDLSWNFHVDRVCSKANRILGFLRRNLHSCPSHVKEMSYKTMVRPILDYCSSVWDPHTQTLINKLEQIQNRAVRFITGKYERKCSVTDMKKTLKIESLQQRRKANRMSIFQQALSGQLAVPLRSTLRPAQRNLRNTSTTNSFIPIATNKNCYKFSFIPRSVVDWNNLPNSIKSILDKDKFKVTIQKYLNQN